jgi:transketolase
MVDSLKKRYLEITYKYKLAHISSCLTSLPIIFDIFKEKSKDDIFILSNGHAGLAYYVVLEHFLGHDAEQLFLDMGIHPSYDNQRNISCSTGSLGLGITVGVGYAISNPNINVHVLISDGETFEGSVWESLNFKDNYNLNNLKIHVNMNGYSAYDKINVDKLKSKLKSFCDDIVIHDTSNYSLPGILTNCIESHYYNLTNEDLKKI